MQLYLLVFIVIAAATSYPFVIFHLFSLTIIAKSVYLTSVYYFSLCVQHFHLCCLYHYYYGHHYQFHYCHYHFEIIMCHYFIIIMTTTCHYQPCTKQIRYCFHLRALRLLLDYYYHYFNCCCCCFDHWENYSTHVTPTPTPSAPVWSSAPTTNLALSVR